MTEKNGNAPGDPDGRAALARLVADEGRRVLASLIRVVGDWQLAEDAVGDAVVRALETWPHTGVPPEPRAWLTLTARRRAPDLVRREPVRPGKEADAVHDVPKPFDDVPDTPGLEDDLLRLVFTCCHPALDRAAQVALALRTLCGLSSTEVARALLISEATAVKRITRAKQKIARAGIPYRVPAPEELSERVLGVAATVYFLFNEGYSATAGHDPLRVDLADPAYRRVGVGPDVLFVHGWPVSGATFRTLLPHLVDHVTCHVVDLPGAGLQPLRRHHAPQRRAAHPHGPGRPRATGPRGRRRGRSRQRRPDRSPCTRR